jgi:hypothetical protein
MMSIRILAVLLMAVGVGCDTDSKPPAAPPPAFKPAADAMLERHAEEKAKAMEDRADAIKRKIEGANADAPVAEKKPDAEAEPNEGRDPGEEMADDAAPSNTPLDVASDDDGATDDQPVTAEKPAKSKSGKWMRGLTKALGRAVSKSLDSASQSNSASQPKGTAVKPPAPEDDPFPHGEPEEK